VRVEMAIGRSSGMDKIFQVDFKLSYRIGGYWTKLLGFHPRINLTLKEQTIQTTCHLGEK
jgi:hypothetical protein